MSTFYYDFFERSLVWDLGGGKVYLSGSYFETREEVEAAAIRFFRGKNFCVGEVDFVFSQGFVRVVSDYYEFDYAITSQDEVMEAFFELGRHRFPQEWYGWSSSWPDSWTRAWVHS